jgi:hypothetical protein
MRIDEALVRVDMGKRRTVSVQHLVASGDLLDVPRRWETAW